MDIDEERRRRVRELAFKLAQRDDERRLSSSYKARAGSLDDSASAQTPDRCQRRCRACRNEPFSPRLHPRESHGDMIFRMDEEDPRTNNPLSPNLAALEPPELDVEKTPQLPEAWRGGKGKAVAGEGKPPPSSFSPSQFPAVPAGEEAPLRPDASGRKASGPWAPAALPTSKLDLKDIMSEALSKSALTAGLAAQATKGTASSRPPAKMSQKERKGQLRLQAEAQAAVQAAAQAAAQSDKPKQVPWEAVSGSRPSPWKAAVPMPKTSLKEAMSSGSAVQGAAVVRTKPLVASETEAHLARRRTASPDTKFPGQGRTNGTSAAAPTGPSAQVQTTPLVPHSKSYMMPAPKAEPSPGASMANIIGQQKREQELVREAVAKRSLQEIQQEQAFQEWWDQESRRAQEEEARRLARGQDKGQPGGKRGRKGRGGKADRVSEQMSVSGGRRQG